MLLSLDYFSNNDGMQTIITTFSCRYGQVSHIFCITYR